MSNAFAIGAVSAVLKNLLDNAVVNEPLASSVGTVQVSAIAPDQVKVDAGHPSRLNIFLYHVEPNAAWRNTALPSRDGDGNRLTNPPLALDLYYLLSAYGSDDFQAEMLLGYAAQLLHEVPVLTREAIRHTFEPPVGGLKPPLTQLATSELAEQLEQIKIIPHVINTEETSKLWSALMTNYRPSIAYQVSVVLIESTRPARTPLPVLERTTLAVGSLEPPFPALTAAIPPNSQPAVKLGQVLRLQGHDLAGTSVRVNFTTQRLAAPLTVTPPAASINAREIRVTVPNDPVNWPAGNYAVSVTVTKAGQTPRTSNTLPLAVAPELGMTGGGAVDGNAVRGGDGSVTLTLNNVKPRVLPLQAASAVVGDREALAKAHTAPATTLTFVFDTATAPPAGPAFLRLRIDGVESLLVRRDVEPPAFDASQRIAIP